MLKADEGAPDLRVVVRCALSAKIRQEQCAPRRLQVAQSRSQLVRTLAHQSRVPGQRIGGSKDHAHLVPFPRQRVAERVQRRVRVRRIAVGRREENARGAERDEGLPRPDHTHADGGCGVVPRAARDGRARLQTEFRGEFGPKAARRVATLDKPRHVLPPQIRRGQKRIRPVPRAGIEPACPGGVRHLGDSFACQPEPEVILGQEHPLDPREGVGIVVPEPDKLGRGEARKDDVARNRPEARIGVERRRLLIGPRVVPEDAGANGRIACVQHRRPVHLTGKADPAHAAQVMFRRQLPKRRLAGNDPVARPLLGPARMRALHVEMRGSARNRLLVAIDQKGLQPRCAQIEPEIHDVSLPAAPTPRSSTRI